MKTPLLLCSVLFFVLVNPTLSHSQRKARLYRVVITTTNHYQIKGILHSVTDSTLTYVSNTPQAIRSLRDGEPHLYTIKANDIRQITIRRKGQVLCSMIRGAGVGLALSVTLATFTEPGDVGRLDWGGSSPGSSTFRPGVALLNGLRWLMIYIAPLSGAETGALIGALRRKKVILGNGSFSFKAKRPSIEPFAYEYQVMCNQDTTQVQPATLQ
ncbi:hypothetical protein [Fibrisoma limi]|uniref:hypothetical protein n=1 Tax=Fibrisoma limi TaxID=663275 RepID=UPI0005872313|nr:hypothetical protein [Fibrisoma limi]